MDKNHAYIDNGLFGNSIRYNNTTDTYEKINSSLETIKDYRDYRNPESDDWDNYSKEVFHALQYGIEEVLPHVFKAYDLTSKRNAFAILILIKPDSDLENIRPGFKWNNYLFYLGKFHHVQFGIISDGLIVKIFNFENEDYANSFLWVDLDYIIRNQKEDDFYKLYSVFSSIREIENSFQPKLPNKHRNVSLEKRSQERSYYSIIYGDKQYQNSARRVMIAIVTHLAVTIPGFLEKFERVAHGRTRNYIARDRMELYPSNPDLCNDLSMSTEFLPGWWIALNLDKPRIEKIILLALDVAGINKGDEIDFNLGDGQDSYRKENHMNKYQGLFDYLSEIPNEKINITLYFSEIEDLIGTKLPNSAKKYRPWWANETEGTHSQRLAWMNAGWLVDKVDYETESVIFRRK